MKPRFRHPLRTLLTGLLALLPLGATLLLVGWALALLMAWLGPESRFGQLLVRLGLGGTGSEILSYLLGVLVLLAGVYLLGLLVEAGLQLGLARALHALLQRIPVVRTVHDVVQKLVGLLARPQDSELRSMQPVWLHFGGPPQAQQQGAAVLGLLATPEPVLLAGQPYLAVLVPTAPVPFGGGLLYVPAAWVQRADIGIEGLTSIYVSMGVTSGQYLGPRR